MDSNEQKNKEIKIQQTKSSFLKRILICVIALVLIGVIYWVVVRASEGTEITVSEFETQAVGGNIDKVYFNNSKVQLYYQDGSAHWFYYDRGGEEERGILEVVTTNDIEYTFGTTTTISILNILVPIIELSLIVFTIVFITKQIRGSNNKSFDFVKSRARIAPSTTKFTDVAGEDEEKAELEDVVDFLKNPKKYVDLGAKIPKGVLLVGPPGTGKTLLARAVAGEANVPFFTISGSDFMELFVGVGASRVRDLFENAKKAKPCIVFIDEIDAIGRQRGTGMGGGNDEREQTLNQLLVQMDGFEDNEGVIVMAATNRVDVLDPALLRPGRFDRRVSISLPDIKGREEILKVHARNKPISSEVDFKNVARITSGFTGAEIENLLNESAILIAKEGRKEITNEDIQKSIMKVTLGPQKKSRVIEESEKYNTAIHESGHALIHKFAKIPTPVQEVSIIPRGNAGGYTLSADDDKMMYYKDNLICRIQMLLGGIVAEKLFVGDISTGASSDLKRATGIARKMVTEWGMSDKLGMVYSGTESELFLGKDYQERAIYSEQQASVIDAEVKKIIDDCQEVTEKLLKDNKDVLLTMANVLIEKETIYPEEIEMIVSGKSKDEVVAFIDSKITKKSTENVENKVDEIKPKSTEDLVDELLNIAKQREEELAKQKEEIKNLEEEIKTEEQKLEKVEPAEETKVQEISEENAAKKKVTRKPRTSKTSETKTDETNKAKKTTKTQKNGEKKSTKKTSSKTTKTSK